MLTQSFIKSFVYSYVSYRECEKITFLREWGDIVRSYGKVTDLFDYTLPNRNLYICKSTAVKAVACLIDNVPVFKNRVEL